MASSPPELLVRIGSARVGRLVLTSQGTQSIDETELSFEESYLKHPFPRPILSQSFEDDLTRTHKNRMRVPPFFSNLLPEGPLRDLIARRVGVSMEREFFLLAHLGEDLPGAVIVSPENPLEPPQPLNAEEPGKAEGSPLRFSLAGVQLKFSMIREGRGLRLPVSGRGGDWLLKLPDARAELVPENEYSMMRWAKEVGLNVPEIELIPLSEVHGLPPETATFEGNAFAIRRFDRPAEGGRTHIEDFAQVLGVYAHDKYEHANYETIGNILNNLGGVGDLLEYVARLVFIVAIGNSDAHLKNWSLIYREPNEARLSPAYDLVSTIQYPKLSDDLLGLNLAGSKRFEDVSIESFQRFAKRLKVDPLIVEARIRPAVARILDSWSKLRAELPIPESFKSRIDAHLKRVPLFNR